MTTISQTAQEFMVKLEHQYTAGIPVTPNTAKAGASKADRDALVELKKAKMILTYKNADCPEGYTVFKFTKVGKQFLKSMGVEHGGNCYAAYRTYYGNVIDTRPNFS